MSILVKIRRVRTYTEGMQNATQTKVGLFALNTRGEIVGRALRTFDSYEAAWDVCEDLQKSGLRRTVKDCDSEGIRK